MYPKRLQGFTFIETLVATFLATLVLGSAWMMFSSGSRQSQKTDVRLQGVQQALLFVQRFEHDVLRLYVDDDHPITISDNEPRITFFIFAPQDSRIHEGRIAVTPITYHLDRSRSGIYRQEGDEPVRRLRGTYEELVFHLEPPLSPETSATDGHLSLQGMLTYLVISTPDHILDAAPAERSAADRTSLWGSIPLPPAKTNSPLRWWQYSPAARPIQ